jgi:hypothetical protein
MHPQKVTALRRRFGLWRLTERLLARLAFVGSGAALSKCGRKACHRSLARRFFEWRLTDHRAAAADALARQAN